MIAGRGAVSIGRRPPRRPTRAIRGRQLELSSHGHGTAMVGSVGRDPSARRSTGSPAGVVIAFKGSRICLPDEGRGGPGGTTAAAWGPGGGGRGVSVLLSWLMVILQAQEAVRPAPGTGAGWSLVVGGGDSPPTLMGVLDTTQTQGVKRASRTAWPFLRGLTWSAVRGARFFSPVRPRSGGRRAGSGPRAQGLGGLGGWENLGAVVLRAGLCVPRVSCQRHRGSRPAIRHVTPVSNVLGAPPGRLRNPAGSLERVNTVPGSRNRASPVSQVPPHNRAGRRGNWPFRGPIGAALVKPPARVRLPCRRGPLGPGEKFPTGF